MLTSACPWDAYAPATLKFCEAHLCSWVVAPTETYSNLAYILVGAYLIGRKGRFEVDRRLGVISIVVGIFSGLYHASHLRVTESLDLASMGLLSALLLVNVSRRIGWLAARHSSFAFLLFTTLNTLPVFLLGGAARLMSFSLSLGVYVLLEFVYASRSRGLAYPIRNQALWQSAGIFATAYAAWLLDIHQIVCDPDNHWISGHSVWHVLNSLCFITLGRYLAQFETTAATE
jgi:hypothetical protein